MTLDAFQQPTRDLLAVLGEQVTVVREGSDPVSFLAFVDEAVQDVGQRGRVFGSKRTLQMMLADWQPIRGDLFTVRGVQRKLEEIMQDDGIIATVVLHG